MFKCKFFLTLLLLLTLCIPFEANADRYSDYIERFAPLAVEHRERFGIPASITLAQGLLESAAGQSSLARKGNNHFGIKCHAGWTGDTLRRNDDAELECFRAYATPEESYLDHSFLKFQWKTTPAGHADLRNAAMPPTRNMPNA